mgnify:CR=1 FL=1
MISVEDTGIGIPEESQRIIFDPFRQSDSRIARKFGGTGLGLSISKRLVELMNGRLTVESEPDRGSVFRLFLAGVGTDPGEDDNKPHGVLLRDKEDYQFKKSSILVADDVESDRALVRAVLDGTPVCVMEAKNGEEAVALADRHKPDAVLMDIRMPVMDGYEAAERIRNNPRTAGIPVVAFAASNAGGFESDERSRLFDGRLVKPVTRSDLLGELVRVAPHLLSDGSEPIPETPGPEPSPPVPREKIDALLGLLEGSLKNEWKDAARKKIFRDIGAFGAKLVSVGEEYGIPVVCDYGRELEESAELFDIERMNRLMNEYPSRIRSIRSILS